MTLAGLSLNTANASLLVARGSAAITYIRGRRGSMALAQARWLHGGGHHE